MNLNEKALDQASRELLVDSVHCRCAPSLSGPPCWYCKDRTEDVITAYLEAMVVNTREELDALPVGAVVIETLPAEANDVPWVFEMDELGTWMTTCSDKAYYSSQINLPARVLYTPEETE